MAIKIYIDQGHGNRVNAGAEGFGLYEQDITFMVGYYLYNILSEDHLFEAKMSRPDIDHNPGYNTSSSLSERVTEANTWGADYYISIHCNANTNPNINGSEMYVYSNYSTAYYLSMKILDQITKRTGTKDNGIFSRPSLYVLKYTSMPAVLVELAYISNYSDSLRLINDQYQFAYGIYSGLREFILQGAS